MLTPDDIKWIKDNREEITENREVKVVAIGINKDGEHPVTGEPIVEEVNLGEFDVVWQVPSTKHQDALMNAGIELETTDRFVTFKPHVPIDSIAYVLYNERRFRVITKDPKGIGANPNRFECLVRLVT